ncbi:MAG: undecaprenyl diphosphate synthase family protein [Lachnospiraceae bacterium]|nr:undecaprenyl diphosphate synthase family protein [Lachnospiraceae bacterium]
MTKNIPKHIGIIPDGNRRWATEHGMEKKDGYQYGLLPGVKLLRMAKEHKIEELTYYGFTVDNCKRPTEQFASFQKACVDAVNLLKKEGADLLVIGNTKSKCFPKELLPYTQRTSINGGGIRLNFLVNYGWQWDLSHMQIDGKPYSYDISRVDLLIRFGGMRRLSGFLPLQSVYSDFYVIDHYWPDYQDLDFLHALEWYAKQDVTLGG